MSLIEKSKQLASGLLPSRLVLIHYAKGRRQYQVSKTTSRKHVLDPLLEVSSGDVEARRDDSAFVDSADEFDDDFTSPVIIDDLELTDVAYQNLGSN